MEMWNETHLWDERHLWGQPVLLAKDTTTEPYLLELIAKSPTNNDETKKALAANPSLPKRAMQYMYNRTKGDYWETEKIAPVLLSNPHISESLTLRILKNHARFVGVIAATTKYTTVIDYILAHHSNQVAFEDWFKNEKLTVVHAKRILDDIIRNVGDAAYYTPSKARQCLPMQAVMALIEDDKGKVYWDVLKHVDVDSPEWKNVLLQVLQLAGYEKDEIEPYPLVWLNTLYETIKYEDLKN